MEVVDIFAGRGGRRASDWRTAPDSEHAGRYSGRHFSGGNQIHEQSLSFILKMIVVVAVLLVGGGWMLETLLDFSRYLFTLM